MHVQHVPCRSYTRHLRQVTRTDCSSAHGPRTLCAPLRFVRALPLKKRAERRDGNTSGIQHERHLLLEGPVCGRFVSSAGGLVTPRCEALALLCGASARAAIHGTA